MPDNSFVELICEFLEALVHQILYLRQLYAREIFQKHRLYGVAVHRSRHPDLNSYIASSIAGLKITFILRQEEDMAPRLRDRVQEALASGALRKVGLTISNPGGQIQERHVFSIEVGDVSTLDLRSLEPKLRAMLLRLQFADSCMKPLPPGCTFEIECHVTEEDSLPIDTWVEGSSAANKSSNLQSIVPIKSSALGNMLKLQLHTEIC